MYKEFIGGGGGVLETMPIQECVAVNNSVFSYFGTFMGRNFTDFLPNVCNFGMYWWVANHIFLLNSSNFGILNLSQIHQFSPKK